MNCALRILRMTAVVAGGFLVLCACASHKSWMERDGNVIRLHRESPPAEVGPAAQPEPAAVPQAAEELRLPAEAPAIEAAWRALDAAEAEYGVEHLATAQALDRLAGLYAADGNYDQAQPMYEDALAIREKLLGPDYPEVAFSLHHLGRAYHARKRWADAERFYQRALVVLGRTLGSSDREALETLKDLSDLYRDMGNLRNARICGERIVKIRQTALAGDRPALAQAMEDMAEICRLAGDDEGAAVWRTEARSVMDGGSP